MDRAMYLYGIRRHVQSTALCVEVFYPQRCGLAPADPCVREDEKSIEWPLASEASRLGVRFLRA